MATVNFFKDSDGRWRWVGSYTNSLIDDDRPRDIITSDAHRKAIEEIDGGEWPHPPLYIWHEKAWRIGETDLVAIDEVEDGILFVIASGPVDEDKAAAAEILASVPCTMSHGVAVYEMKDAGTHREITRYRTTEVSVLPQGVALPANPFTYFTTLSEDSMVSQEKRSRLLNLLPESLVNAIEGGNKSIADEAVKEGVLHKDADETIAAIAGENQTAAAAEPEPEAAPEPEPEAAAAAEPEAEIALSLDDAQVLGEVVGRAIAALQAEFAKSLASFEQRLAAAEQRVVAAEEKALKAEKDAATPLAGGALDRFLVGMVKASAETPQTAEEKEKSARPAEASASATGTRDIFAKVVGGI